MTDKGLADIPFNRSFDCAFGPFVPRLTLLDAKTLRLDIPTPGGRVTQVVGTEVTAIRPGIAMLSWIEQDGTVVVHLQDHETATVHSHARLSDGTLLRSIGTISWPTAE